MNTENGGKQQKDEQESYSFIKEVIKPETFDIKRTGIGIVRLILCGLVIGVFACLGFFMLKPWAEETFGNSTNQVSIPEDKQTEHLANHSEEIKNAGNAASNLSEESYQELMDNLYDTVKTAEHSMVSIRKEDEKEPLPDKTVDTESESGLIVADNGQEFLILADRSICEYGPEVMIKFYDGSEYQGSLKNQDDSRGIAIFSVEKASMSNVARQSVRIAELGNSYSIAKGDMVIAMGNLFGYSGGVGYGIVSSVEYDEIVSDGKCDMIMTDIAALPEGTGFLFNQDAQMIGIVKKESENQNRMVNAMAVSDLKTVLEILLNGGQIPYMGVHGITITEDISKEQGIPMGLYVTDVDEGSPAMERGIQNGDVIQRLDDTAITGTVSYEETVLGYTVGRHVIVKVKRRSSDGYADVKFEVTMGARSR